MDFQNAVFFAAKGGQGTTVTACATAIALAEHGANVLIVDLRGDAATVLGLAEIGDGVVAEARTHLRVLRTTPDALAASQLPFAEVYVFDADADQADRLADRYDARRVLVTRSCYLALRRATALGNCADDVVVVEESGRALTAADIAGILGVPLVTRIAYDPAVARGVDSGLLASRLPAALRRAVTDARVGM